MNENERIYELVHDLLFKNCSAINIRNIIYMATNVTIRKIVDSLARELYIK